MKLSKVSTLLAATSSRCGGKYWKELAFSY